MGIEHVALATLTPPPVELVRMFSMFSECKRRATSRWSEPVTGLLILQVEALVLQGRGLPAARIGPHGGGSTAPGPGVCHLPARPLRLAPGWTHCLHNHTSAAYPGHRSAPHIQPAEVLQPLP